MTTVSKSRIPLQMLRVCAIYFPTRSIHNPLCPRSNKLVDYTMQALNVHTRTLSQLFPPSHLITNEYRLQCDDILPLFPFTLFYSEAVLCHLQFTTISWTSIFPEQSPQPDVIVLRARCEKMAFT